VRASPTVAHLGSRKPLLEGACERRIPVHLDAMLFRLATPHDHPVEAFGRSPHRDVGLAVTRLCNRLTPVGPQNPFTFTVGAMDMEARGLAFVGRPLMQSWHQCDTVAESPIDEPARRLDRSTDGGREVVAMNDVFVQSKSA